MAIDSRVRPRGDQLEAERDRLRLRFDEIAAGLAELRAVLVDAQRREDAAYAEASRLVQAAGGSEISFGPTGSGDRPPSIWSIPNTAPPAAHQAAARHTVVRAEARPAHDAAARIELALVACRAALGRTEAAIARAEAEAEQDRRERQERWVKATTERSLPAWRDQASACLARLGLAEG